MKKGPTDSWDDVWATKPKEVEEKPLKPDVGPPVVQKPFHKSDDPVRLKLGPAEYLPPVINQLNNHDYGTLRTLFGTGKSLLKRAYDMVEIKPPLLEQLFITLLDAATEFEKGNKDPWFSLMANHGEDLRKTVINLLTYYMENFKID